MKPSLVPADHVPALFTRKAQSEPVTIDAKARTVRLTWSTGAPVQRFHYIEVLSMEADAVDLSRLRGAPLLNAHRTGDLRDQIGIVLDAGVESGTGWALVKFSDRPEVEAIWRDVGAGIIRNVSVGYAVKSWTESTDPMTGETVRTITKWTPIEISLVPVAADPGATIRQRTEDTMPKPVTTQGPDPANPQAPGQITTAVMTTEPAANENRAAVNAQIRSLAEDMQLGTEFANGLIDRTATIDEARAAALDALRTRSQVPILTQRIQIGVSHDDPEVRCRQMGEAVYARIDPSHQLSEPARGYAYLSLSDLARESLRLRGNPITGMSKAELVTRSLHTTSDFSTILGDAVGRVLRKAYLAAPAGIKKVARQTTAPDFRTRHKVMLGEAPTLVKVNEKGEFKSGTMAEAKEVYKLDTFGRIIGITRQVIINDDLGAFTDLSARFGQAAASFEAATMVALLVSGSGAGPNMDDGVALFHANHKNLAAAGAVISATTLSAGRLAMRRQTGLSGDLIEVTPKFLLVPPDQETTGEKELAAIAAAKTSDANPFAGQLQLVVENRLTSTIRWYITADAAISDGLEYAYLEGQPGPQIETKNGFEVDGVQVKVREDFGCGFVDFRTWYQNPGA